MPAINNNDDGLTARTKINAAISRIERAVVSNVYNLKPSNTLKWRRGRALARRTGPYGGSDKQRNARLACVGDSTTLGLGGLGGPLNFAFRNSYPSQLANVLDRRGLPAHGEGIFGDGAVVRSSYDSRVVITGWTSDANTFGGRLHKATAAASYSYTPDNVFDTLLIRFPCYSGGGSAAVLVDGVQVGTINNNQGTQFTSITLTVPLGLHMIAINWVSGTALFASISPSVSAEKGITVANMGWSGAKSLEWNSTSSPWSPLNALKAFAPDLSIIDLGINDALNSVTPEAFTTNMQAIIDGAKVSGDVMLMTFNPLNTANSSQAVQDGINNATRALAVSNDVPLLDLNERWGDFTSVNAIDWMSDQYHPTGRGYADIAEFIANVLMAS